jgi:hypothetical protein
MTGILYIDGVPERFDGDWLKYTEKNVHRVDGPAVIWDSGHKAWCINGIYYSFEDFLKQLPEEEAILVALEWK